VLGWWGRADVAITAVAVDIGTIAVSKESDAERSHPLEVKEAR
jgi:hypothetical protein